MNAIEIKNLNKSYKDFSLKDISFNIESGTIMGLVGQNGAGKTTIIKCITGLIKYDGEILVLGEKLNLDVKNKIGVVFEDFFVSNYANVKDVNKILGGIYKNWDSKFYFELVEKLELPLNKKFKDFSKGMKMKLKIACAMSIRPELLILDEPTSGLDPVVRDEILDLLLEFIEDEKHSFLISSHITSDLEKIADYITFVKNGEIIFSEEKYELIENMGLLKCSEVDFENIDKSSVVRYKKEKYFVEALINNREEFKNIYPNLVVDSPSIDEIMVLYSRGEEVWMELP